MEDNDIQICKKNGVEIRNKGSELIISKNRISKCGGCGISVYDQSKCTLHENEVFNNQFDNLEVRDEAKVFIVANNSFHHSLSRGINVHDDGLLEGIINFHKRKITIYRFKK